MSRLALATPPDHMTPAIGNTQPGQGRNLKTKISASGAPQWWWWRVTRAGWDQL